MKIKVKEVAFHRNGVCGRGFWNVLFSASPDGGDEQNFLAVIPSNPEPGDCFVLDTDLLGQDIVTFGVNSWRGDHFESAILEAIREHQRKDNLRLGLDIGVTV